jgi:hypothetical protein
MAGRITRPAPGMPGPSTLLSASALPDMPKIAPKPSIQSVIALGSPAPKASPDGTVEVHCWRTGFRQLWPQHSRQRRRTVFRERHLRRYGRIAPDKLLESPVHQQRLALGSLSDYTLGHGEMIGSFLTAGSGLWADGLALLRRRDWAA